VERQRCRDCRWFLKYTGQEIGQCRRYPPTENTKAGWLEVANFDWCGEWADNNGTVEESKRRELVRQFAVAIAGEVEITAVDDIWRLAAMLADYEGQT